jgi:PAS domain S-box-containing protein
MIEQVASQRWFNDPQRLRDFFQREIQPSFVTAGRRNRVLRVWVVGGARGLFAYHTALLLSDLQKVSEHPLSFQILATDADPSRISDAWEGLYPESALENLPAEVMERVLVSQGEGRYQASEELRKSIYFTEHDFAAEPPFLRQDLIIFCLESTQKERIYKEDIAAVLYTALNPGSFVLLTNQIDFDPSSGLYLYSENPLAYQKKVSEDASIRDFGVPATSYPEQHRWFDRERELAAVVEASSDAILVKTLDAIVTRWNRGAEDIYGYTAEEMVGKPVSIICPSDRKNEPLQIIERIKRREKGISLNTIRVTKDGIRKHISLTVSPIFDMYGKLTHFSTIERDITELVKTEEELRRREYQLHAILNHLPVGVWYTDEEGTKIVGNPAGRRIWGDAGSREPDNFQEYKAWYTQTGRRIKPQEWALTRAVTRGDVTLNEMIEIEALDGTHKIILNSAVPIRDQESRIIGGGAVNEDITERIQIEDRVKQLYSKLREKIEELETIFRVVPVGIAIAHDPECKVIIGNPTFNKLLGVEENSNISTNGNHGNPLPFKLLYQGYEINPDELPMQYAARHGVSVLLKEMTIHKNHTGEQSDLLVSAAPLFDDQGNKRGSIGMAIDVTSIRKYEVELKRSEARFRGTFENAAVGIAHTDLEGRWLKVNQTLSEITGYTQVELYQMTFMDITHPDDIDKDLMEFNRLLKSEISSYAMEKRYIRKNRKIVWIDLTVSLIRDEEGSPVFTIAIIQDISERKYFEDQLRDMNENLERHVQERTRSLIRYQEQLRALSSELTLTEQKERRRLATELHDYLAQLLVVCRMNIMQLRKHVSTDKGEGKIAEIDQTLDDALRYTRTLIAELSPTVLFDAGFLSGVKWLAKVMERYNLTVRIEHDREYYAIPEDQSILLFQCVRELLMNIVKHAHVDEAEVHLSQEDDRWFRIDVIDRGGWYSGSD